MTPQLAIYYMLHSVTIFVCMCGTIISYMYSTALGLNRAAVLYYNLWASPL